MSEPTMPQGPMPPMDDEPPMGPPENEEPETPEPPMDDEPKGGNKEIDDIFDKLDTEKQSAVIKYAKSMVNDDENDAPEPPMDEPDRNMPMEGRRKLGKVVNEIINNILNGEETEEETDRRDEKIRNKKVTKDNPFVSKR